MTLFQNIASTRATVNLAQWILLTVALNLFVTGGGVLSFSKCQGLGAWRPIGYNFNCSLCRRKTNASEVKAVLSVRGRSAVAISGVAPPW